MELNWKMVLLITGSIVLVAGIVVLILKSKEYYESAPKTKIYKSLIESNSSRVFTAPPQQPLRYPPVFSMERSKNRGVERDSITSEIDVDC